MKYISLWICAIIIYKTCISLPLKCPSDKNLTEGCTKRCKYKPNTDRLPHNFFKNLCSNSFSICELVLHPFNFDANTCPNQCECKDGYKYDDVNDQCVLPKDCPPCPPDQILWSQCDLDEMRPTNSELFSDGKFDLNVSECFEVLCICKLDGYAVLDNKTCAPRNQSRKTYCKGKNEVLECAYDWECKNGIRNTCPSNIFNLSERCHEKIAEETEENLLSLYDESGFCRDQYTKCNCEDGYVRNMFTYMCVKLEDCSNCPSNRNLTGGCKKECIYFNDTTFKLNSCSNYNLNETSFDVRKVNLAEICDTVNWCECINGYVYNNFNDMCVLPQDCPNCHSQRNLTEGCKKECKNGKYNLCLNYNQNIKCEGQPCDFNSCECKDTYVYDNGTDQCVQPEDCSYLTITSLMTTSVTTSIKAATSTTSIISISSNSAPLPSAMTANVLSMSSATIQNATTRNALTKSGTTLNASTKTTSNQKSGSTTNKKTKSDATLDLTTLYGTVYMSHTTLLKSPNHTNLIHTTLSDKMAAKNKPAKPKGPLEVSNVKADSCKLKWEPPEDDDGETVGISYIVEIMDIESGHWVPVSTTKTPEVDITGLNKGKDYLFRVKAVNAKGESEMLITYTVTRVKNLDVAPKIKPATPKGPLKVSDVKKDGCKLTWKPPEDDGGEPVDYYVIEKMDVELGRWLPVCKTNTPEANVMGLNEGKDYLFRVKAVTFEGESELLVTDIVTKAKNLNGASDPSTDNIKREGKGSNVWEYKAITVIAFLVLGAIVVKIIIYLTFWRRGGTDELQENRTIERIESAESREPPPLSGATLPLVNKKDVRCKECQLARQKTEDGIWIHEVQQHGHSHIVNHLLSRSFSDSHLSEIVSTNEGVNRPTTPIDPRSTIGQENIAHSISKMKSQPLLISSKDKIVDEV